MNIINWGPMREIDDLFGRYRHMLARQENGEIGAMATDWRPTADISETDTEYQIKADLPEVERKDVHISVENGSITISGERSMDSDEEDATQHRIETFYGTFSRSFALPQNVDKEKITANSANGVLKVHLPKTKVSSPKRIEIAIQ